MIKSIEDGHLECLIVLIKNNFDCPVKLRNLFKELNSFAKNKNSESERLKPGLRKNELTTANNNEAEK